MAPFGALMLHGLQNHADMRINLYTRCWRQNWRHRVPPRHDVVSLNERPHPGGEIRRRRDGGI